MADQQYVTAIYHSCSTYVSKEWGESEHVSVDKVLDFLDLSSEDLASCIQNKRLVDLMCSKEDPVLLDIAQLFIRQNVCKFQNLQDGYVQFKELVKKHKEDCVSDDACFVLWTRFRDLYKHVACSPLEQNPDRNETFIKNWKQGDSLNCETSKQILNKFDASPPYIVFDVHIAQ